MSKNNEILKDPIQIIEEIENQLEEVLNKKREEIEKELEERIKQEKEKAKKKIDQIEKELEGEKEALISYRTTFTEFENNKANIKSQKEEHFNKAIQFLRKIETLTAQSLEELKKVRELNQKLDELHQTAKEKAVVLKKDLEEKFGIVAEGLETKEHEEDDLEQERIRLKKIKELLGTEGTSKPGRKQTGGRKEGEEEIEESEANEENELNVEKPKMNEEVEATLSEENETKEEEALAEKEPEESDL